MGLIGWRLIKCFINNMDKKDLNILSDKLLIEMAISGSDEAYFVLHKRYYLGLTLFISEFLDTCKIEANEFAEQPQDIAQEALYKAFMHLSSYDINYEFSTWLYNIAKNCAIDYTRKRRLNLERGSLNQSQYVLDKNSPEEKLISSQSYCSILSKINQLDTIYREVAQMRFIKEYAYEEISEKLDIPLSTVKTRIKRAKSMLKELCK